MWVEGDRFSVSAFEIVAGLAPGSFPGPRSGVDSSAAKVMGVELRSKVFFSLASLRHANSDVQGGILPQTTRAMPARSRLGCSGVKP